MGSIVSTPKLNLPDEEIASLFAGTSGEQSVPILSPDQFIGPLNSEVARQRSHSHSRLLQRVEIAIHTSKVNDAFVDDGR